MVTNLQAPTMVSRSYYVKTTGPLTISISAVLTTPTTRPSQSRLACLIALKCPAWTKSKQPSTYALTGASSTRHCAWLGWFLIDYIRVKISFARSDSDAAGGTCMAEFKISLRALASDSFCRLLLFGECLHLYVEEAVRIL